jgi:hypothetical protein
MKNIIITENHLRYITEALGVPDNILGAAEELFDIVAQNIKSINYKSDEYNFDGNIDIELGYNKKIVIDHYEILVQVKEFDEYDGKPEIMSMGMGQTFKFDRDLMMKKTKQSSNASFTITFAVPTEWEPNQLYDTLMGDKNEHLASIAHELKHKYDKQAKRIDLIGRDVKYTANQKISTFAIPVIDQKFFRYLYYISIAENLVRPTEVASKLKSENITKSQFREFLENNRVYKELIQIKNFTYEDLINEMYQSMDRVDALFDHIGMDTTQMTDQEKVEKVLELVYINLANIKVETFDDMVSNTEDMLKGFLKQMMGSVPSFLDDDSDNKMEQLRKKFISGVIKYEKNPLKFFQVECEKFNYIATKMLKKIGKLYAMAKDDEPVNESIINWDLHQQLMEKKYGKKPIRTSYNFKK